MAKPRRATVYLDEKLYRAAKIKAAHADQPLSFIVSEALKLSLREDAIDMEAVRKRRKETSRPFAHVLKDLKRDGLL